VVLSLRTIGVYRPHHACGASARLIRNCICYIEVPLADVSFITPYIG